ncbi:MAG: hypothetical protein ACTSSA_15420 [Candidatus Freyarchaeota archaeon]
MPANRGEALLAELGIQVDRDTIRKYYELFRRRAEKYAGLSFTGSKRRSTPASPSRAQTWP